MQGIVLCGGQSARMGSDKALLNTDGVSWAQTAINVLAALQLPVSLSVNEQQYDYYSRAFPNTVLIKDTIALQLHGPLLGLLSTHLQYIEQDIFLLACDMPSMESAVLIELYHLYKANPAYDAFIFTNNGEPEPLCGIYCKKGLSAITKMAQENKLPRHSMKYMLGQLNVFYCAISDNQKKYFKNFNTPADLHL